MFLSVPAMMMRGGTSRAMYFLKSDLDATHADLDELLPAVMGSPDQLQIDGLGGGSPTTSKVAIVSPSREPDCDVDYLFAQVRPGAIGVDWKPTCGNVLVGVAPFAIERGLVGSRGAQTPVRVRLVNTGARVECVVNTPSGQVEYAGSRHISGLTRPAAPVSLAFREFAGGTTGSLFPAGSRQGCVDGVPFTAIDACVCAVLLRATDLGLTGAESAAALNEDSMLLRRIETLRRAIGERMGLGDVSGSVLPKVMVLSAGADGAIRSRYFVPDQCHPAHAVSGAICLASAAALPGTLAAELVPSRATSVVVEHPSGSLTVGIDVDGGSPTVARVERTARKLFDGTVFAQVGRLAS
ncbi:PrpF domain-containing protein [Flexivirga meconopsidis]|uniref:PrpF domain-containing protein n=1 Tax=Flexivirga meconopsidis TaxID=2977121 RepID=UPI0022401492|nr:PrpF domain-containing protein [Flexivirga meconopsidis]